MLTMRQVVFLLSTTLAFSACGGLGKRIKAEGGLSDVRGYGGLLGGAAAPEFVDKSDYSRSLDGDVLGVQLNNKKFDIPVVFNREVEQWMQFFTGRGREHFKIYLERMGAMIPVLIPRLRESEMPEDLIYLAMIESGFSTRATSHAGAAGPWQFMPATGKIYNMRIDAWVDERRDPSHSTDAAISYLKNLYEEFGDWELACAAYNSGEGRIRNAIQRLGSRNFWDIANDRHAIRRETRDYVPKMMAAAILAKNAEQFGFVFPEQDPKWLNTAEVKLNTAEDLRAIARVAGVEPQILKQLNPELVNSCTPPNQEYSVRVPNEAVAAIEAALANGELGQYENFRHHTVKRGDSVARIARKYRISKDVIFALNNMSAASEVRLGQALIIPGSVVDSAFEKEPERLIASTRKRSLGRVRNASLRAARAINDAALLYTVRQGDTLYDISRRYSVTVNNIKDWNAISRSNTLQPGRRLKLYVRNDSTRI